MPQTNDTNANGYAQGKWTAGFSEVLQRLPGERKAIAADLGVPYSTYSNWIYGLQSFPPDLLARLFAVTGEWEILRFFLDPLGLNAVHKYRPGDIGRDGGRDLIHLFMGLVDHIGKISHEIEGAQASPGQAVRGSFFLNEAQRLIAEMLEMMSAAVKP